MACVLGKKAGIKLSWLLELSGANSTQSELSALMFNVRCPSVKNVGPSEQEGALERHGFVVRMIDAACAIIGPVVVVGAIIDQF
jgi:hypothetical protein